MKSVILELNKNRNVIMDTNTKRFKKLSLWHYSSLDSIYKICNSGIIRLNKFKNSNDPWEACIHSNYKNNVFSFSFSRGRYEKIPMWAIYSERNRGAAIRIDPTNLLKFLKTIKTVKTNGGKTLYIDKDFTLEAGFIFYVNDKYDAFYYNKEKFKCKDSEFISLLSENCFIKKLYWNYENEFRIVVRTLKKNKYEHIQLNISKLKEKLRVVFAPEVKDKDKKMFIKKGYCVAQNSKIETNFNNA